MIHERHRHRYEFNCLYEQTLTEKGLQIVGRSLDGKFVEMVELPGHPWYVAVQFHPEFKSKPRKPHPLFAGFVEAAHRYKQATAAAAEDEATADVASGCKQGTGVFSIFGGDLRKDSRPLVFR